MSWSDVNWPARTQCTRLFTSVDGRNKCLYDCLWITNQQLSNDTRHYQQRTREKRDRRRISNSHKSSMQKWHHKQSKKYISKVPVGFVKCHEWRVECNRPTLVCPRIIAAAIAFEVALHVASVARRVFLTSQLYRHLSALSVLSGYCGVVNTCWLPSCDTLTQYWCYFDQHQH